MKIRTRISEFMTASPHSIHEELPVHRAAELMEKLRIRHLPVLRGGELVGLLSERALKVALTFRGPGELRVSEVMDREPFVVPPEVSLERALEVMADRKHECAIVQPHGGGRIQGIFTEFDALRILRDRMRDERLSFVPEL